MTIRQKTVAKHGLFWLVYFLYSWLTNARIVRETCSLVTEPYEAEFFRALLCVSLVMGATYFTIYGLLERYLLTGQRRAFYIGLLSSILVFVLLQRLITYYLFYPVYYPTVPIKFPLLFIPKLLTIAVELYTVVGAGIMLYFVNKWYQQQQLNQTLQLVRREAELELLQSQVQPHFIFNTLNNIYTLSLKNSPQTPEMIYRLSALLDYTLYDSKSGQVPLQEELNYINNYLALQKIRFGPELRLTLNAEPGVADLYMAPMLLLPFVENCFTHGVSQQLTNGWIEIDLRLTDNALHIRIENSKEANNEPPAGNHGIGLQNVRSRLAILYNDQHTLTIRNEPTVFTVHLLIDLSALQPTAVHLMNDTFSYA
jgi:sensor histidine kinase YesM